MQQAVELFELLQANKTREAEKSVTVETQPFEREPRRNEPLFFLTLGTVEGIVGSADPGTLQEQTSWEGKMEKFVNLSHTYSSDNTISGEKCYMVDEALYKNILLAVAARKQNERTLTIASEKLEQHISEIENSHGRVIQREKEEMDNFVERIKHSQVMIRSGHGTRMKMSVMADIIALKDSITSSAGNVKDTEEMQQLQFQVAQYESIVPVYQSWIKDTEELNKRLSTERLELAKDIEHLKEKLDRVEALVFSMGTPDAIRRRAPQTSRTVVDECADQPCPSSEANQNKDGTPMDNDQLPAMHIDLTTSPTESRDIAMETTAEPAVKLTFQEVLASASNKRNLDNDDERAAKESATATPPKLISLFTLSSRRDDVVGKRARPTDAPASEPTPPANKKPPRLDQSLDSLAGMTMAERAQTRNTRNQEREKWVEEEVRKVCQGIQWTRGPLPRNIDHWFYDLRNAGTEPPDSLVGASRLMVLAWKKALGRSYIPSAGRMVMSIEHAHRTFKALTLNMPISGWVSRAYAKHQMDHDNLDIPMLVAKEGDPLKTRPCPLIY
jgi:hypothetical protein